MSSSPNVRNALSGVLGPYSEWGNDRDQMVSIKWSGISCRNFFVLIKKFWHGVSTSQKEDAGAFTYSTGSSWVPIKYVYHTSKMIDVIWKDYFPNIIGSSTIHIHSCVKKVCITLLGGKKIFPIILCSIICQWLKFT